MKGIIPELTPAEISRFYGKLRLEGCGLRWHGPVNNHGYGRFEIYREGRRVRIFAHRLACKLLAGEDPARAVVRHGCDTPACCTPGCLLPGTQAQNVHDAVDRGRMNTAGLREFRERRDTDVQARLAFGMKWCPKCKCWKPFDQFFRSRNTADGFAYLCKKCQKDHQRDRRRQGRAA